MTVLRPRRSWLLALCAASACTSTPETQVVTGRVDDAQGAVAVRALVDGTVATAAQVRSDGSFTLALPAGARYQLEVLTSTGVKRLATRDGSSLRGVSFKVCEPVAPFDIGKVGHPGTKPPPPEPCKDSTDPSCKPPPNCGPDGSGCPPPPPPCKDPADPSCKPPPPPPCDPGDPSCPPPPPPPCADPTDPNCKPPPCDPGDPSCPPPPPPCTDPADPSCKPPPCTDPADPSCKPPPPGCDPATDPNCNKCPDPTAPGCAPPCPDPKDPQTCKDPCVDDPGSCGCKAGEPDCWPKPPECDPSGVCKPDGSVVPDHPPGDFGCKESGT